MQAITKLGTPEFKDGRLHEDKTRPMLTTEEFSRMEQGSAKYVWDDYSTKIEDGKLYRGQRQKSAYNTFENLGEILYEKGGVYQGFTKNKTFNGKGRLTHGNGNIYQGDWKDGKAHGKGVFVQVEDGMLYEGDWVEDEKHGYGKEEWKFGAESYTGDFVQSEKTGRGVYLSESGNSYDGEFLNGQFHGKGVYKTTTNRVIDGFFQHNELVRGKMILEDGSIYEGEFKNWKMHGAGKMTYPNGTIYVGTWDKDLKNGIGTLFDFDNSMKQREDWSRGTRKNFVKTPTPKEELLQQLKNPGYNYQSELKKQRTLAAK